VNSISEMSWESARSTLGAALSLKGGTQELKGPCPNCGGQDRFWIRPGVKLPTIFGCRAGCEFKDIMRELSHRGLVKDERLSPEVIYQFKKESPVSYQLWLWAMSLIDIVAEEGCFEDEDMQLLIKAVKVSKRANRNGVMSIDRDFVWDFAQLRERGVIHEHV